MAQAGKMDEAIGVWEEVLWEARGELALTIHFNLAAAYQHSGKATESWHHLGAFIRASPKEDPEAQRELEQLENGLAGDLVKLGIACTVPGAHIYLGDKAEGTSFPCPLTWWFKPGKNVVFVEAEGHVPKVDEFIVRKLGGEASRLVTLEKKQEEPEPPVTPPRPVEQDSADATDGGDGSNVGESSTGPVGVVDVPEQETGSALLPWTVVGAGGTMVIAGAVMHGLGFAAETNLADKYPDKRYQEEYDKGYESDVAPKLLGAYVLYGVGAATAAGGLLWLLTASGDGDATSATVTTVALPGGGGIVAGFRF